MTRSGTVSGDVLGDTLIAACTVTIDEHGIVTAWSDGAHRLLGYRAEEVVGRPAVDLLAEDASRRISWPAVDRSLWSRTVRLRRRSGGPLQAELLAHRGVANDGGTEWLLVCSAVRQSPLDEHHAIVEWGFTHAPYVLAIFDTELRLVRANADMERAVAMTDAEMRGLRLSEIVAHPDARKNERAMRRVLKTGERQYLKNFLQVPGESRRHAWEICIAPVTEQGGMRGVCFAARDTTEQYWARQRLLLVNEASTQIGSTLDVARTAQDLVDVAVPRLADFASVDLLASLEDGAEPPFGVLTRSVALRRVAHQSVLRGCPEAAIELDQVAAYPASSPPAQCLAAGRSARYEMTDPAVTRWVANDPVRSGRSRAYGIHSMMTVPIRARGNTLGVAVFLRHRHPDAFDKDDLLVAEEITTRAAVCVDNAHRYTRERTTAVTLQRSLLPHRLPDQVAVDVASRYLSAGAPAGVGGDWFDVIPLSGARVGLVVGDVVGHGIQASATMGRLRMAVRTLADIDLPPDELLTHLDDLVIRLNSEAEPDAAEGISASCVYAVYDPVSRRCTLASAGHPQPAVVAPSGTAELLDMPIGPPLGLGGLPFEATEIDLLEGSLLALYTDGLIAARGRDVDDGLAGLRHALTQPARSLEDICDNVLKNLLPAGPDDDVALLVTRTCALGANQVAAWDVPSDPAAVAQARQNACDQVTAWGLEDNLFTTELVVSELVTNAIRYGNPPFSCA